MATAKTTTPATTQKALAEATNTATHAAERAAHASARVSALRDDVEQLKLAVSELQDAVVTLRKQAANG